MAPEQIAYVDETGIDTYLYRTHGYAPRGQRIDAVISGRKYKRESIVAAQLGKKIVAPFTYSGTMNSSLFETWFTNQLLARQKKLCKSRQATAKETGAKQVFASAEHRLT